MKFIYSTFLVLMVSFSCSINSAMAFELSEAYFKQNKGIIKLTILDGDTKGKTPARVEVVASDGKSYIARDALLVGGDCDMVSGVERHHGVKESLSYFLNEIKHPFAMTSQFYSEGESEIIVPEGLATIKVYKGPEYNVEVTEVEVFRGKKSEQTMSISRWANMPKNGWYSSDGHLHIERSVEALNPYVSKMMQAEDIHVANLLQMGKSDSFSTAPQYAFGQDGLYQEHNHILASAQENPRTHILGHSITFGAKTALHDPENYLIYKLLWEEAINQGGINGAAHFGFGFGGEFGLPLALPNNLIQFIEVLSFNLIDNKTWYEMLNMGFRITPVAGTDYPCGGPTIPGQERFYTKIDGEFSYKNWLESVRKGKTFVTTGPLLDFSINGNDIGEEIFIEGDEVINISGKVRFDPIRDNLQGLEVIENGQVIYSIPRVGSKSEIAFKIKHRVKESSWLALRGYNNRFVEKVHKIVYDLNAVHSAPIYITIKNSPPIAASSQAKATAIAWSSRLKNLEAQLDEKSIALMDDGALKEITIKNREQLLYEVQQAKEFFELRSQ